MAETIGKTDNAWLKLFEKYPIEEQTKNGGLFEIQADAIKEFREPRLMTKFDTVESVASPLRELGLNILPVSRHSYVIGKFDLYEAFPDTLGMKPTPISLPDYETLRVENLTSESNAIGVKFKSSLNAKRGSSKARISIKSSFARSYALSLSVLRT